MKYSTFCSYKDAYSFIKADYSRYRVTRPNVLRIIKLSFADIGFNYTLWMRLAGVKGFFYPICKLQQKRLSRKYGIQIQPKTKIGKGLYIGHGYVIVNPTAVIGENCNLSQFTTIGSNYKRAAEIGNNVYIGPNVCIVEHVHIGDNAKIGAGAVVVKDVPANATAVGVPSRNIIK